MHDNQRTMPTRVRSLVQNHSEDFATWRSFATRNRSLHCSDMLSSIQNDAYRASWRCPTGMCSVWRAACWMRQSRTRYVGMDSISTSIPIWIWASIPLLLELLEKCSNQATSHADSCHEYRRARTGMPLPAGGAASPSWAVPRDHRSHSPRCCGRDTKVPWWKHVRHGPAISCRLLRRASTNLAVEPGLRHADRSKTHEEDCKECAISYRERKRHSGGFAAATWWLKLSSRGNGWYLCRWLGRPGTSANRSFGYWAPKCLKANGIGSATRCCHPTGGTNNKLEAGRSTAACNDDLLPIEHKHGPIAMCKQQ